MSRIGVDLYVVERLFCALILSNPRLMNISQVRKPEFGIYLVCTNFRLVAQPFVQRNDIYTPFYDNFRLVFHRMQKQRFYQGGQNHPIFVLPKFESPTLITKIVQRPANPSNSQVRIPHPHYAKNEVSTKFEFQTFPSYIIRRQGWCYSVFTHLFFTSNTLLSIFGLLDEMN